MNQLKKLFLLSFFQIHNSNSLQTKNLVKGGIITVATFGGIYFLHNKYKKSNKNRTQDDINKIDESIKQINKYKEKINEHIHMCKNKDKIQEYFAFITYLTESIKNNNFSEDFLHQLNKNFIVFGLI